MDCEKQTTFIGYDDKKKARLPEVDLQELRKMVYSMVDVELITEGARTDRRYTLK